MKLGWPQYIIWRFGSYKYFTRINLVYFVQKWCTTEIFFRTSVFNHDTDVVIAQCAQADMSDNLTISSLNVCVRKNDTADARVHKIRSSRKLRNLLV